MKSLILNICSLWSEYGRNVTSIWVTCQTLQPLLSKVRMPVKNFVRYLQINIGGIVWPKMDRTLTPLQWFSIYLLKINEEFDSVWLFPLLLERGKNKGCMNAFWAQKEGIPAVSIPLQKSDQIMIITTSEVQLHT